MSVGIAWPCEWCRSSCRGLWDSARRVMGGDPAQPSDSITVYSNLQRQSQSRSKSHPVGMLIALLFAGSTLLAVPPKSWAQEVIVRVAPPAVRVETAPPPPSRYHVWDPGHWRWDGRGYELTNVVGIDFIGKPGFANEILNRTLAKTTRFLEWISYLRPVKEVLSIALEAKRRNRRFLTVPIHCTSQDHLDLYIKITRSKRVERSLGKLFIFHHLAAKISPRSILGSIFSILATKQYTVSILYSVL